METDIVIVGAGPAGLCLARSLCKSGLDIVLVDQQALGELENPKFDGREIALTQKSVEILKNLDVWDRIDPASKSSLTDAKIFNGSSPFALGIGHELSAYTELGWLVPNHLIRKAAYDAIHACHEDGEVEVIAAERVIGVETGDAGAKVQLESGQSISARLVIAADSRYSPTRRMMGISADMHDFGKSMLVCGMTHDVPHHHAAWEWFGYGQTLALLPMNPEPASGAFRSSVVVTLAGREIDRLMSLDDQAFNHEIERRFERRLGRMTLATTRHAYPLVSVYPRRFVGKRFATVGDAAVGMHPVTAHGFNFGLSGIDALSRALIGAEANGLDIADDALLKRYENHHRRSTRPLYLITAFITRVYTDDRLPAKLARNLMLRFGEHVTPFKQLVAASLAGH
ncbi:5-demethoxyubiquinol-8 5-hydroxylase UbiM [Paraburkholderia sp. DHOC27]|uniref:5-demethoxyubiquinol-8 5-hydroxylase UbiM n=1 Tax=Paraburkholderia sp. DHOC27 TaxID=2303330 RepID=UPI000E3CD0C4|nr:5-demethoxyubiquinol-8 5-hydroxylase UbiM [Paraburkholderia sp. DHOC27]RFU46306.1 FAD-dependent hydroxylase [Paraburkholderia sp. DHOC27]